MFLIDLLQYFVNQLLIRFFVADNKNVKGDQSQSQDQSSPWMQPYPNEPYPYPQYQPPPQPCPSQKPPSNSQQKPQQPPCPSQQQQQQQPQYPPPQYPPQQYPDYPQSQNPVNPPLQEQIPTNDAYCCGCSWLKYCNCCGENCGWYLKCCQSCGCANCCNCDCLSACISNLVNCVLQTASCGGCDCNCGGSFRDSDKHQRSDNNPLTLRGCDGCSGCDCCMTRRAIDTIEVTTNSTNEPNFSFEAMSSGSGGSSDCCCDCSSLCSRLYSTVISAVISSPLGFMSFMRESAELIRRMFNINYIYSRRYVTSGDLKRHGGKVAVITYGNSGVGAQMAKILLKLGFRVIVGWKENVSGESAVKPTESKQLKVLKLDSSSMESVREFAKEVSKSEDKIDLLINSAATFEVQNIITKDGIEKTFAENYLGQFLLTNLLINKLKKAENGRIVNVSSIAHYLGYMDYNTVTNKDPSYSALRAYAQSKLAIVLFTRELSKRIIDTNMSAYVVSPEIIEKRMPLQNRAFESLLAKITDPMNGIQTLLYVSLDEELKNESGFYYNNLKKVYPLMINASDDKESVNLWKRSEKLVKLEDEYKLTKAAKTSQTAQEVTTEATNVNNVKAAEVTPDVQMTPANPVTQQEEVNPSGEEEKGADIEKSMSDQNKLEESQD